MTLLSPSRFGALALAPALLLGGCAVPKNDGPARAPVEAREPAPLPQLSIAERNRLSAGQLVVKKSVVYRQRRKYVGGLAFLVVGVAPERVLSEIFSTRAALEWMPQTLSAKAVGGAGNDLLVRFEQGEKPFVATHTLHVWRDDLAIRWKLDPRQHHDIEDAWGFLSAAPWDEGRSLLTLGVLLDLGDGVVRAFAEPEIQDTVLGTPRDIRDYVESRLGPSRQARATDADAGAEP